MAQAWGVWRWAAAAGLLLLTAATAATLLPRAETIPPIDGPREPLRLGLALQPGSALAILAEEQGFFAAEGLDVSVRQYASGKLAVEGLFADEVDVATTAMAPVVFAAFDHDDVRILATMAYISDVHRIVARKDHGITRPADLRGKRIAVQRASATHFFLHMFLVSNHLTSRDVSLEYLPVEDLPDALAQGRVDAISTREPLVTQARQRLGDSAVVFARRGLDPYCEQIVARESLVGRQPEAVRSLLRALVRAKRAARQDPDTALQVVAARLGVEASELAGSWNDFDLSVSLDQSLLSNMEDVARWAIQEGLTRKPRVPNYLRIVYMAGLQDVDPRAVTIIR